MQKRVFIGRLHNMYLAGLNANDAVRAYFPADGKTCAPGYILNLYDSGHPGSMYIKKQPAMYNCVKIADVSAPSPANNAPQFINVSPTIQTTVSPQVSPQISPVFIQQEKPVDSPVNAGTTMGTPVTGAMPGFDAASGYLPTGLPGIPSYTQGTNSFDKRLLLIPAGILLAILLFKKRKTVSTYTRRAGSYAKARIHRATA